MVRPHAVAAGRVGGQQPQIDLLEVVVRVGGLVVHGAGQRLLFGARRLCREVGRAQETARGKLVRGDVAPPRYLDFGYSPRLLGALKVGAGETLLRLVGSALVAGKHGIDGVGAEDGQLLAGVSAAHLEQGARRENAAGLCGLLDRVGEQAHRPHRSFPLLLGRFGLLEGARLDGGREQVRRLVVVLVAVVAAEKDQYWLLH